jgi:hypothetical protein
MVAAAAAEVGVDGSRLLQLLPRQLPGTAATELTVPGASRAETTVQLAWQQQQQLTAWLVQLMMAALTVSRWGCMLLLPRVRKACRTCGTCNSS